MDDLSTRMDVRNATQRSRRGPSETLRLTATFDGGGALGEELPRVPFELTIEATNDERELASWLDDEWWADLIRLWGETPVTVHVAPTPGAMLNPVVLYQLDMLRRVTPSWRLVGHAYSDDVDTDAAIADLVRSPYHEVRFVGEPRPTVKPSDRCTEPRPIQQLFGRIRRQQERLDRATPVLVLLPTPVRNSAGAEELARLELDRASIHPRVTKDAAKQL
jgi:hypothetical protein